MTQKGLSQDEVERIKALSKNSLAFLCQWGLGYTDWDKVHDDLEVFLAKPSSKKALLLPRGHLKSSIVTIGYTIQRMLKNPNIRVLIANQVWDMSRKFLGEIKGHLEQGQLKYLFGDFVSARWNADEIIVRQRTKPLKEPTILTTGVEAETTGGHFDLILLDDLTGLQNSQTPEQREKTKRFRRSMINLLEPGGTLIEIGTRWHLDDTFSVIFEKESKYYDIMVRKVIEEGKIIFPMHFSKKFNERTKEWTPAPELNCMDYIDHLKTSMPIDEFAAQYLNDPITDENQLFKKSMFGYWKQRPEGLYVGMCVDLAISQRTEADYTAISVLGMDKDWNIYVLDYTRGHWTPTEIIENIFNKQSQWHPHTVGMEVNGFQRTLKMAVEEEMRSRKQYFGVEEIRNGPAVSKENRIKSLEPFYRQGKVFHATWMDGKEMEMEFLTFPKGRHDDIIDSMAMCLPFLSPGVGIAQKPMQPGTWEYVEREARRHMNRDKGFFNYGR
jgi:predicted phage terminase large subunit-like protein